MSEVIVITSGKVESARQRQQLNDWNQDVANWEEGACDRYGSGTS